MSTTSPDVLTGEPSPPPEPRRPLSPGRILWSNGGLALVATGLWLLVHLLNYQTFIFHDSWEHNFPVFYGVARNQSCGDIPRWLGSVDSGSPVMAYVPSFSFTQLVRIPTLLVTQCLGLPLVPAIYVYKAHIFLMYLGLAIGMFVLGRVLFRTGLAATYLFVTTLFAGLCLDALHSDQAAWILFWFPWVLASAALFHRNRASAQGALYASASVLFLCLGALDHNPHFAVLLAATGGVLYVALFPLDVWRFARRHLLRLWPAGVVLAITGAELWVAHDSIANYVPALREELIVDPAGLRAGGFVQPTAPLSSLMPLATLASFDSLAKNLSAWQTAHHLGGPDQTLFVNRFDSVLLSLGFIPIVLVVAYILHGGVSRQKVWWLGVTGFLYLVSLQQSQLYWLIYRLPFFNIFRSYFLYLVVVMFLLLIISGLGMDAYLTAAPRRREVMLRRALAIGVALTVVSVGFEAALLQLQAIDTSLLRSMLRYGAVDIALVLVAAVVVWLAASTPRPVVLARWLTVVLVLSQSVYVLGTYRLLGISLDEMLGRYRPSAVDSTPPGEAEHDPATFLRQECTVFAECYTSMHNTASIQVDLNGTFWRSKDEPIYQPDLNRGVAEALTGITHPVFWLSQSASAISNNGALVSELNGHKADIGPYLETVVHVQPSDLAVLQSAGSTSLGTGAPPGDAHLLRVDERRDSFTLSYSADHPVYLNAAVNYEPAWQAKINGLSVPVVRGNFNGLALLLPPGSGTVSLEYHSLPSDFFFSSRYVLVAVGLSVAWWLTRSVLRDTGRGLLP
ncbi:MAG: hypothetical protein JO057_23495 [Chloroflexi bacterium]|nr:hypothetical protein [Chloroflexota bacterium]